MQYAVVLGTVVATQVNPSLKGLRLTVLQACNRNKERFGSPFVAVDPMGVRHGDLVIWVGKREASLAVDGAKVSNMLPIDAAVTGWVDAVG